MGAVTMGMVAYLFLGVFDNIFNLTTFWGVFLQGFISGVLGIISGIIVLLIIKNKELYSLINAFGHRFQRQPVTAPEQREL